MVFSSILFLYYFLPVVLLVYYIAPKRFRNSVFLLASLFFYAWGEPVYVFLMLFSILFNYGFGLLMTGTRKRRKRVLTAACMLNLLLLGVFKYAGFAARNLALLLHTQIAEPNIPLPLGISFFTFQAMSYVIDVYREEAPPQKNLADLALYITAFPQLIAGPIVRYTAIMDQLKNRKHTLAGFSDGVLRFVVGLSKKVLLSNQLGAMADTVFAQTQTGLSAAAAWSGIVSYTLQIYFDFSGYSDMAIGLGKMFGFSFDENFDYPYISQSVSEFWRRWHISLGSWFRDYVYIPLGGNRKGKAKTYRNLLIVWFLTGLWHGASWNFVAWGLYYGVFIALEKAAKNKMKKTNIIIQRGYTMLAVMFGWVFFRANGLREAFLYFKYLFGLTRVSDTLATLLFHDNFGILAISILGATPLVKKAAKRIFTKEQGGEYSTAKSVMISLFVCLMLAACTVMLANSTYNPFIYFRF